MKFDGGPSELCAVQVKTIYREMIELEVNGNTFLLRAN